MGFIEAGSRESAVSILSGHGLFLLSLEPAERAGWWDRLASYFGRVKRKDMIIFTRQLATLLEARLPLGNALKTLREQTNQPVLKEAVVQISEDIDAGLSFSQALERQGNIFPEFYVMMIRGAEVTGNLDEIIGFLADYAEKEDSLLTKASSALIYPAIVVGLFVIVAFIMVTFVFPQIGPVFTQAGVKLPVFTRALLGAAEFLSKWWSAVILLVVVLVAILLDYAKTPEGRALVDDSKVRLPIISKIYLPLTLARFSNATSFLIRGGIPVAQALEIVSHMVDNVLYRDILHDVAQSIREGEPLSRSLGKYPEYFPPLVSQMLAVGETTGKLEQIFLRLAGYYGKEADNVINNIVDLIQPVLIIGIGVMVGILFASILIPIYRLTTTFQ